MKDLEINIDVIRWLAEKPHIKKCLFYDGYEVKAEEFLEIMDELEGQGFYGLIYMLLLRTRNDVIVGEAFERFTERCVAEIWEKRGSKAICEGLRAEITMLIEEKENMEAGEEFEF